MVILFYLMDRVHTGFNDSIDSPRDFFDLEAAKAQMYTDYKNYKTQSSMAKLLQLKQSVENYKQIKARLLAYGKDKQYLATWLPGYKQAKSHLEGNGSIWSKIGEPVNLDFDKLATDLTK